MVQFDSYFCGSDSYDDFACWSGIAAAILFFLVNIPQILLNYKRKSVSGFSFSSVFLRLVGASFHVSIGIFSGMAFPLLLSGILNLLELIFFIYQFALYNKSGWYYLSVLAAVPQFFLSAFCPKSTGVTKYFNPIIQIVCCIPYVAVCLKAGSTIGISLFGFHINFIGGILGMLMCSISCNCSGIGWFYYLLSIVQSVLIFVLAISYNEFRIMDKNQPVAYITTPDDQIKLQSVAN